MSKTETEKPVITLGSDNYPPYNYLNEDGVPTGDVYKRQVVHRDNEKSLRLCKKLGFIVDNKAGKDENPWIFLRKSLK